MFEDFLQKQIKCRYLHKINEKSRAGINRYFYIKNPRTSVHHFFPCAVEISFLHTKVCRNAPFKV
jgi:hypothetical protein